MLKEGWDVTNLYTIVPLRAANARILIEQSIGRGLRLPYGKRTGVTAVDRLNIVAHDKFQEIIDEANRPDSAIRLQQVVLEPGRAAAEDGDRRFAAATCDARLGLQPPTGDDEHDSGRQRSSRRSFTKPEEQKVAQIAYEVIRKLENQPQKRAERDLSCQKPEIQAASRRGGRRAVSAGADGAGRGRGNSRTSPPSWRRRRSWSFSRPIDHSAHPGGAEGRGAVGVQAVHAGARHAQLSGPFGRTLDSAPADQSARSAGAGQGRHRRSAAGRLHRQRPGGLRRCLLRRPCRSALRPGRAGCARISAAICPRTTHARCCAAPADIARFIHAQMQEHYWEDAVDYEVEISKGFTELKPSAYTASRAGAAARFPPVAGRQEQHGEVSVRRLYSDASIRCRSSSPMRSGSWRSSWIAMR